MAGATLAAGSSRQGKLRRASYSDVILAFGAVAIIALMILPLPLVIIDTLVAVNISIGIGLLLIAIYIPSPVAFSSFPSVLLLSTLFRLALSIAITRLILLEADAGHIVDTFGNLVAGGNLVVGLVVFLIITVVQFIVVAKGAERVAEVAARFTLDAMPGKQLSIDSDLRSGLLDKDDARAKRRLLETESQLYGSLDGAMKFVKGDAIAGIVIIIINLLGGLAIGVLQMDMELGQAVRTYSILTIGDGLVAQIPALLGAISAGLVVTRTASTEDDRHLGEAIGRQITSEPRVLLISGCVAMLMTLVPGFPSAVFFILGLALLAGAGWLMRDRVAWVAKLYRTQPPKLEAEDGELAASAHDELAPPPGLLLELAPDAGLERESVKRALLDAVAALREEYGVPIPAPTLRVDSRLSGGTYRLAAFGARIGYGRVRPNAKFLPGPSSTQQNEPSDERYPVLQGRWTAQGGNGALSAQDALLAHVTLAIRRRLGMFIGIQETSNLLNRMSRDYPDLVKEVARAVPPQRISEVLKRLVDEGIPIRNLRDVLEAIADAGGREKDVVMLTEYVRVALKRHLSERFAGPDRTLPVVLVHPELEDRLRQAVRVGSGASQLAIEPDVVSRLIEDVRREIAGKPQPPVLLCSLDVRRHVRKLVEPEFFELPVLSYQELAPELRLAQVGQVNA